MFQSQTQNPQMVQGISNNPPGQVPTMAFPYQAGKQFPYGVAQSPQMVFAASSPIVHPISQNFATPPIPILQSSNSCSSVASNTTSEQEEGSPSVGPTQSPPTPLFPQTFQPVQLISPQPTMMIPYNGTNQPLVPVVQVQTPNGPQFQPIYYLPDQQFQGTPPLPIPGGHTFLTPEQHPIMQNDLKNKGSRSGSLSYDGRSMSFSRDGSEISDSGDAKYYSAALQAGSLRRTSSDASHASRDGYGSDCSCSRLGSEYFGDSHCSDAEEDTKTQDAIVESPDKMFYPTQPSHKISPPPGLAAPAHLMRNVQLPQKSDAGKECNPQTQTYTSNFLMQYQSSGDCLQCPGDLNPEHPTLVEHLNKEQCNNLHRYIDRLGHTKGYQVFHSPDRVPKKRPTSKERQEELYKTELCNYWINGQKCRFGKRCIFAHGQHELRMPKRKIERNRLRPPFRKQVVSILNKLSDSNFDTLSTEILCSAVEDVRNDEHMSLTLVKAVFNKALNVTDIGSQKMYAEIWRKLLNVHPMSQKMASQMMSICLHEYQKPRHKNAGVRTMKWIAQICKKKVHKSEDIVHKILSDMFSDNQREEKVELWCKLIEALKTTVNTDKYFPQLKKLKMKFNQRIRFMIMDLEDLKQRKWVPRQ